MTPLHRDLPVSLTCVETVKTGDYKVTAPSQSYYPEFDSEEMRDTIAPLSQFDSAVSSVLLAEPGYRYTSSRKPHEINVWMQEAEQYPFQRVIRTLASSVLDGDCVQPYLGLFADPRDIEQQLAERAEARLRETCTRSLVAAINAAGAGGALRGETPHDRYQDFVGRAWQELFPSEGPGAFPVLASSVGLLIRNTADAFTELCRRLTADRAAIGRAFGIAESDLITSIGGASGDSHGHGRAVAILAFASGARLVYKPRDISCEAAWQEIVSHVNRAAGTSLPTAATLAREGYGYVAYIAAEDVSDMAPQFMRSSGELAAVLHLLDARDMHFENIIATRRGPVAVDLETLMHPARVHVGPRPEAEGNAYDTMFCSLYGVGILPLVMAGKDESSGHVDLGFLGGDNKGTAPFKSIRFEEPFTDRIRLVLRHQETTSRATVVGAADEDAIHSLAEQMADGFTRVTSAVLRDREAWTGLLHRVAPSMRVRYVHNPTALYGQILRMTASAGAMADPAVHLALLKRIAIASKTSDRGIIGAELAQLAERDVPYFTVPATGTTVYDADGKATGATVGASPLDRALEKARNLDEFTVGRQLKLLYSAFCSRFPDNHLAGTENWAAAAGTGGAETDDLRDLARTLADDLLATVMPDKFAHLPATWIGPLASAAAERPWPSGVLGYDLYTGRTGPALALAAAARHFADDRYRAVAAQIFSTSAEILADRRYEIRSVRQTGTGAYTGMTGILFALSLAGRLLDEPDWISAAREGVSLVTEQITADSGQFDVTSGIAGVATMLAAIGGPHAEEHLPRLAGLLGEAATTGGPWAEQSGFAHGTAGLLHAVSSLVPQLGAGQRASAEAAADALLDRLSGFYDPARGDWFSNLASRDQFSTGWCHGAAGISLALAECARQTGNVRAQEWLSTAIGNTLAHGFGRNLTWCHGDLGNHNVLATIAAAHPDRGIEAELARIEDGWLGPGVIRQKISDHRSRYAHTNSIMVGTSGILIHLVGRLDPTLRVSPLTFGLGVA